MVVGVIWDTYPFQYKEIKKFQGAKNRDSGEYKN